MTGVESSSTSCRCRSMIRSRPAWFLKGHGVYEDYTLADLDRERQALDRLGI
jgi:hypothetical protein